MAEFLKGLVIDMNFSEETRRKIDGFAEEQSKYYLDAAEMTYMEKVRFKTEATKHKIDAKMARFKSRSEKAVEAQNDLTLYMSDYMGDLMSQGMSEQEAFEKAKVELEVSSGTDASAGLRDRYNEYYANLDIAAHEAIGLFYAAFVTLGLVLGALIAFLISGGRTQFTGGGWIDTLIGGGVGLLLGVGCAQLSHAIIAGRRK